MLFNVLQFELCVWKAAISCTLNAGVCAAIPLASTVAGIFVSCLGNFRCTLPHSLELLVHLHAVIPCLCR